MNLARELQLHGFHLPQRQRLEPFRLDRFLELRQTFLVRPQLVFHVVLGDLGFKLGLIRQSQTVDLLEPRELQLHLADLRLFRCELRGSKRLLPGAEPALNVLVFRGDLLVPVVEGFLGPGRGRFGRFVRHREAPR